LFFNRSSGAVSVALAIVVMLIAVAPQPAQAQTFSVLHTFTGGADGGNPDAGLTWDKAGNLYGTAHGYGSGGHGTVYRLTHGDSGWAFSPLYAWSGGVGGAAPLARVVFGPNGILYGTTTVYDYGTVFNLRPPATAACKTLLCPWTETVLHTFEILDGDYPGYGDLLFDQAGNIYGTTTFGGSSRLGTVYELTPSGTESVLYSFAGSDGETPENGLIFDNAGDLYGTTANGGGSGCNGSGCGTVFELMPANGAWTQCTLSNFQNGNDGVNPYAGLIFDQLGNLYGGTIGGGTGGSGTVFELTPVGSCTWTLKTLHNFTAGGGECGPYGTLVMDGSGNLYGTTKCDGATGNGNVFELAYPNWTYTSLYDFTNGSDGGNPTSNVIFDASGNLYGTASTGGNLSCGSGEGCGVVWKITR
jgi:uncharacterized repeat protein (TIGR03803 family)